MNFYVIFSSFLSYKVYGNKAYVKKSVAAAKWKETAEKLAIDLGEETAPTAKRQRKDEEVGKMTGGLQINSNTPVRILQNYFDHGSATVPTGDQKDGEDAMIDEEPWKKAYAHPTWAKEVARNVYSNEHDLCNNCSRLSYLKYRDFLESHKAM